MGNVWREEMGKYIYLGGKKVSHCEKLSENYPLQRQCFSLVNLFALAIWGSLSIAFPSLAPIGHHLGICVPPWCLRNSADTDSWQLHESHGAWLGHMGYNSPKIPLGNINTGNSDCEFPLSWPTPKNASLPPSLFPSVLLRQWHFTPSPSAVFVSKGFAWFCFLMHCWYRLPCSFFHGQ